MFSLIGFLWFVRTTKSVLFWLYLWQLKEYHIGRFLDHFRTEKGKNLILGKLNLFKVGLLLVFPVVPLLLFFFVFILYISEFFKVLTDFLKRQIKKPVLTRKTIFLISAGLFSELLFLFILLLNVEDLAQFTFWCLAFDVLTPLIASVIVLIFQPLAALGRNQIIKKAQKKRESFKNLLVIGITGSYGKTSTKEVLAAVLSEKFKVLKTQAHQNSEVGISLCILNDLKPEHEIFVVEMGAYNKGGIKLLCDIAKPRIGILTGINEQHLSTFGSQENIVKAKYELIESLPADGVAFFNAQNRYCLGLYKQAKVKKFLYGGEIKFPGEENILGAVSVAHELGMSEEEISRAVAKIENKDLAFGESLDSRLRARIKMSGVQISKAVLSAKGGIINLTVIDATYSANPDSIISHLEYFKDESGRKIIIMPCLIELGRASKEVHKRIGQKIGEVCDLAIITAKERFKDLKEGAIEKGMNKDNILFIENPKKILKKLTDFCRQGDVLILESRMPLRLIKHLVIVQK